MRHTNQNTITIFLINLLLVGGILFANTQAVFAQSNKEDASMRYAVIESATNNVVNVILLDPETSSWQPPQGHFIIKIQPYHTSPSRGESRWDGNNFIRVEKPKEKPVPFQSDGNDIAEFMIVDDPSIEAGDIVAATGSVSVRKSQKPYESNLMGIISINPGIVLGEKSINTRAVALAGRLPVKVSTENGPIAVGDYITSSSVPGVGMKATKAGRVVGVALEAFECACQGKALAFVNPSFYLGTNLANDGSLALNAQGLTTNATTELSNYQTTQLVDNAVNADGTLSTQYSVLSTQIASGQFDGQILTPAQIQQLVREEVGYQLASTNLPNGSNLTNTTNAGQEATASAEATSSAQLAQQTNQTLAELDNLLGTVNLKLETLTVTGNSQLAQTQVAGSFSQDGTLIIDYGKQINVLAGTLYLQNDPLAGCPDSKPGLEDTYKPGLCTAGLLVAIGPNAVTIDKLGNIVLKGEITASKINIGSQASGTSAIVSGTTQVQITTPKVTANSLIFITPTVKTTTPIAVTAKQEGIGFTVEIPTASPDPVPFNWLVVN